MHKDRPWRPQLTQGEVRLGWAFFGFFFLVFPFLVYIIRSILGETLGLDLSDATANGIYFGLCTAIILVVFWSFLKNGFFILLDHLPENLFALTTGATGCIILTLVTSVIPLPVENPVVFNYPEQFAYAPGITIVMLVILWPIIEETLFRGLLFGWVRRHSRVLAYVLSVGLFLLFKVWPFAILPDAIDLRYLLLGIQYLPLGLALTWCYDNGGSIWSAITLHMFLNGLSLFLLVH